MCVCVSDVECNNSRGFVWVCLVFPLLLLDLWFFIRLDASPSPVPPPAGGVKWRDIAQLLYIIYFAHTFVHMHKIALTHHHPSTTGGLAWECVCASRWLYGKSQPNNNNKNYEQRKAAENICHSRRDSNFSKSHLLVRLAYSWPSLYSGIVPEEDVYSSWIRSPSPRDNTLWVCLC